MVDRRRVGVAVLAASAISVLVGVVGLAGAFDGGPAPDERASASVAPTLPPIGVTADDTSTGAAGPSAPPPSSPESAPPSSAPASPPEEVTSEPTVDGDDVLAYLAVFRDDVDGGRTDALVARLHPAVLDRFGPELCREFVEREILALRDYRATGPVAGPERTDYDGTEVSELFRVPIAFRFQGADVEGEATFAPADGAIRWFATCR